MLGINIELLFQSDVSTSISLDSNEFIIAEDQEDGSSSSSVVVVGWAQLRCLGPATSIWDPNQWYDDNDGRMTVVNTTTTNNNNSRRENEYLLEKEVDEIMWEEFEDDPMEFPNGWSSLPWTKEYRKVAQAAEMKRYQRATILEKERIEAGTLYELTSLHVKPSYRKKGIATNMIQKLLQNTRQQLKRQQQQVNDQPHPSYSYVITLDSYVDWYHHFGFDIIIDPNNIPKSLQSKIDNSNGSLVCMRSLM